MATAIVALYDQGGGPLGAARWLDGLVGAMKGFSALHYHSVLTGLSTHRSTEPWRGFV